MKKKLSTRYSSNSVKRNPLANSRIIRRLRTLDLTDKAMMQKIMSSKERVIKTQPLQNFERRNYF